VRRFLQQLWARRRARPAVVCYLRENGPLAYELDLFTSAPRERADAMIASDLGRDWTQLTRVSLSAFLSDLATGDVLLLGTEGEPPHDLGNVAVRGWLRRFARIQPSPVAALISVAGGRQLLYVQQHATESVNRLLDTWGLDKGSAERQSYARLGPASLEAVADRLR
jgi:hypothetical protein